MENAVDIVSIRKALRRIMERKGVAPTTLSLQVSNSKTLVKDLLEKTEDVKVSTLVKLAGALDVELEELMARPRVPITGYIGAGGHVIFEDFGEDLEPDETVPRPPGITGPLIALAVRGDSMLPRYKDGDILYVQKQHDGVLEDYIGEDCAVRLKSGEIYVKELQLGSRPGVFTLLSVNASPITDVEVEWASPVAFVMPYRARRRFC